MVGQIWINKNWFGRNSTFCPRRCNSDFTLRPQKETPGPRVNTRWDTQLTCVIKTWQRNSGILCLDNCQERMLRARVWQIGEHGPDPLSGSSAPSVNELLEVFSWFWCLSVFCLFASKVTSISNHLHCPSQYMSTETFQNHQNTLSQWKQSFLSILS